MKKLNLCCGNDYREGWVNVDVNKETRCDVVHDLNSFPYPFEENSFDEVRIIDGLEHLDDVIAVMEEIHRICINGAKVEIRVPHFSSLLAFTDPTHKHFFSTQSFDYLTGGFEDYQFYSKARFRLVEAELQFWKLHEITGVAWLMRKIPRYYEKLFAFWFPAMLLTFKLEPVKNRSNNALL